MARKLTDQEIVDILTRELGAAPKAAEFDIEGHLIKLSFSGLDLACIPSEIALLTNLRELDLSGNQLGHLPLEIGSLTNLVKFDLGSNQLSHLPSQIGLLISLQSLDLSSNHLSHLPPEIVLLANLDELDLYNNQLEQVPPEIWQLTSLEFLSLGIRRTVKSHKYPTYKPDFELVKNRLSYIPPDIGRLTNLRWLNLSNNKLSQLPHEIWGLTNLYFLDLSSNQLRDVPSEIGLLTNLKRLFWDSNQLNNIPPEIWWLMNLEYLGLTGSNLSYIPPEIGQLTKLKEITLGYNQLSQLPPDIGKLIDLEGLYLHNNRLDHIPAAIWQLENLRHLTLDSNQLSYLPPDIGQLTKLQTLQLGNNQLNQLPTEIGQLLDLQTLTLDNNPSLLTPPPEIVMRGKTDVLTFLRALHESSIVRYEAKLLVVGEGGTGKSSLLRALRNEEFDSRLSTTHGIELGQLELFSSNAKITLNTWDFGGQHIYHATHQFFLTQRSLYLVTWNARLGAEQGRLHYWLETIKALASDAPVLLVATHADERAPDLNYQLLKATYPQLIGNLSVSNMAGVGIDTLKRELTLQAARLPLMGQPWPQNWLNIEQTLLSRPEHHIDAATYVNCCSTSSVDETIAKGTLGAYLHDLGKILYFRDDYVLCNLVVLKPNWITKAISLVLTDESVSKADGILQHSELPRIWVVDEEGFPYGSHLYPIFLRLMERFDLSYQIESDVPGEHATRSLVPQLLPYQPPINLLPWPKMPPQGQTQVEMVYRFDFVPAGIMSWFIVRTHRYTRNLHWREGVLLEYQRHEARVELNPMSRELRLLVWGIQPYNFFTILMNTVDIILSRFQGLVVRREIPCICHWDRPGAEPCRHFYSYEELVRRMEARRYKVECAQTFAEVSVPMLLYGIHTSTDEQVMSDIKSGQQRIEKRLDDLQKLDVILEKLHQQSELIVRNFTRQWNLEMQKMEAECPNTFLLELGSSDHFNPKNWISQEYVLHLVCQHPPGPHKVGEGYKLREAEEWWKKVSPWLNHAIKFLKFGVPMGRAIGAIYDEVDLEHMKAQIDLMEEITQQLPEVTSLDTLNDAVIDPHLNYEERVIGPALRALYGFLSKADSGHIWGGLHKTLTPDGNILWLCETHRKQYEVKPLNLEM